jgi:hypothetical protein
MANPINITIGTNTYSLITAPSAPGQRSVNMTMHDTVSVVQSPFTMQSQTQQWPGADWWEATISLPPMPRITAAAWVAFLAQCRGQQCCFMIGDGAGTMPMGRIEGQPVVDGTVGTNNQPASTMLYTRAWTPFSQRVLLPGDYVQLGQRLYMNLDVVASDGAGNAVFNVWPSLREQPADGAAIIFRSAAGLFRLADNQRSWTADVMQLYGVSIHCTEAR